MSKKFDFITRHYTVYGVSDTYDEHHLGIAQSLGEALRLCRSHVDEYLTFSLYAKITDVFGSEVFLGCVRSTDF